jgi:hypothetical protein
MQGSDFHWSDQLAKRLLAALPNEQLKQLPRATVSDQVDSHFPKSGRDDLVIQCRDNPALRREIIRAWRSAHSELIEAAQSVSIETSPENCDWMIKKFGAENVLIELITDEYVGWQIAEWVIDCLPASYREQLEAIYDELASDLGPPWAAGAEPGIRIVIFGGHARDESKMSRLVFQNSPFTVRWKLCDTSQGSPDERELTDAMAHADGVLVVTSMVSHVIMQTVKRIANDHGIPWRTVAKATATQLRRALSELFPDRTANQ